MTRPGGSLNLSTIVKLAKGGTGTPTTAGAYSFTVLATNTYGTAPLAMSITITQPAGGNYGFVG